MPKRIGRREFLSVTAGAGLSLPALLPAKVAEGRPALPSTENRVNGANSGSAGETGKSAVLDEQPRGKSVVLEKIRASAAEVQRWDYVKHPVRVSGNLPRAENVNPSDPVLVITQDAGSAFDGFGAQGSMPAAARGWQETTLPTPQAPLICEIDYGTPVAVTAFVHYFYVPGSRDLRFLSPAPSAFHRVRIGVRAGAKTDWRVIATLDDLSSDCPQVLPVINSEPARYWRIEILELARGAEMLMTYEIETYTGGVPRFAPVHVEQQDLPAAFATRIRTHQPSIGIVRGTIGTKKNHLGLKFSLENKGRSSTGELQLAVENQSLTLIPAGESSWRSNLPSGSILMESRQTPMGLLLELAYAAKPDSPIKYQRIKLQMSVPKVNLYYMPAYVWSGQPVDEMVNTANVQTRLAVLGAEHLALCLVPGTDRGMLGFSREVAENELLLGPEPTPVLLTAVAGEWFDAYRFAVEDIYDFREQPQTVPVSEIQYGISRYMVQGEDVWEPTLGTVRSWPSRDPHDYYVYKKGFDAFALYGTPYSVPTYWARYAMNGDELARERCRSIIQWLCRSGVRMQQGPARGAFFTLQDFRDGEEPSFNKMGATQANTHILTSQSTGAALWTLLYYRKVSETHDPEIDTAIEEATEWLLKTQQADGGWPYGHDIQGRMLTQVDMGQNHLVDAPPSSGSIWNIWALWRLGKQTGEQKYLQAADRGSKWFAQEFVAKHHYHGYWEDVGPGSREGYDAAIAAVAFGEMGERGLALETGKDAVQWIFTRQIEAREPNNSAGLVAEQTGWPPASYCNPMMALAAWTVWQISGDEFWRPFAMIPKAVGWWYQPDLGAMVWIVDSSRMAPIVGPAFESYWSDWCIAQVGTLTLRWLVREVNRRARPVSHIDEESLTGTLLGRNVRAWAPQGGLRPILPSHGQVNWLGFRNDDSLFVVLSNSGAGGLVGVNLTSRNINGVAGATIWPKAIHSVNQGQVMAHHWNGGLVQMEHEGTVILEWGLRQ